MSMDIDDGHSHTKGPLRIVSLYSIDSGTVAEDDFHEKVIPQPWYYKYGTPRTGSFWSFFPVAGVFLAVVGSIVSLIGAAYIMRHHIHHRWQGYRAQVVEEPNHDNGCSCPE